MKRFSIYLVLFLIVQCVYAQYDQVGHDFGNGLRRVKKGYYYGFIDSDEQVVIPLKYLYLDEFTDGKQCVVARLDNSYGMIDKNGKNVVSFKYDYMGYDYGNGLRMVRIKNNNEDGYLYGFIDKNGKEIIPLKYVLLDDFSEGKKLIWSRLEEDHGVEYLIDEKGKRVYPYIVEDGINGPDGLVLIMDENGRRGLVNNRSGKLLLPPTYSFLWYPSEGMLRVSSESDYDNKYGFLDGETYKMVIPAIYDNVADFSDGLAAVCKDDKVGFIDKKGKVIIPFDYYANYPQFSFAYGLCPVIKRGEKHYAIIDKNGRELTPYIYGNFYDIYDPVGFKSNVVGEKNKYHYFDHNGKKYESEQERDIAQFEIMKDRASKGDERYFARLATIYSDDTKCKSLGLNGKDYELALYWYLKAANSDNINYYSKYGIRKSDIYYQIGNIYENGYGVPKNITEAKLWYKKGAGCDVGSWQGKSDDAQRRLDELGADLPPNPIPSPTPSGDFAHITWLDFPDYINQKEFSLKIAIDSNSKIEDVYIVVNGMQNRGIKTNEKSSHDMMITYPISLQEGKNLILVKVTNGAGTTQEEKTINYRPLDKDLPSIDWLDFASTASKQDYLLKLGIKSKSKIEDVSITINGALSRGVKTVKTDDYTMTVNRTITLSEGTNRIVVSVRNAEGVSTSERVITYNGITPQPVVKEKRIALVIGNSHYSEKEMNLPNPENDAKDVAKKLETLGFEVVFHVDASFEKIDRELTAFSKSAKDYDVALFYYAGHGIQSNGVNYIIPSNIEGLAEDNLKHRCVSMDRVLDALDYSNSKLKIVVLDACRNDPISRRWHRDVGSRGLSMMNAPVGTIISFSTAPGQTAQDGKGHNSPYTEAFLQTLDIPNLDALHFFQSVGASVQQKTNRSQIPWLSSSFTGDFYFNKQ